MEQSPVICSWWDMHQKVELECDCVAAYLDCLSFYAYTESKLSM